MPGDDLDELEIVRHRFDSLEHEMAERQEEMRALERSITQMAALGEFPHVEKILARQQKYALSCCRAFPSLQSSPVQSDATNHTFELCT